MDQSNGLREMVGSALFFPLRSPRSLNLRTIFCSIAYMRDKWILEINRTEGFEVFFSSRWIHVWSFFLPLRERERERWTLHWGQASETEKRVQWPVWPVLSLPPFLWQGNLGLVLFSTLPSFILCQLVSAVCLLFNFKGSKLRERERERENGGLWFEATGLRGR